MSEIGNESILLLDEGKNEKRGRLGVIGAVRPITVSYVKNCSDLCSQGKKHGLTGGEILHCSCFSLTSHWRFGIWQSKDTHLQQKQCHGTSKPGQQFYDFRVDDEYRTVVSWLV